VGIGKQVWLEEIWFVDRPMAYYDQRFSDLSRTAKWYLYGAEQIRDAMAYLVETSRWPVERARGVWPVCQAGVWAIWSDGTRARLEL